MTKRPAGYWAGRFTLFAALTAACLLWLTAQERTANAILGAILLSAFLAGVIAAGAERLWYAFNSPRIPARLHPSQWLWYVMQAGIMIAAIWIGIEYENATGNRGVAPAMLIGLVVAAIVTGLIAKLLDWLARIRFTVQARRVRTEGELSDQGRGASIAGAAGNGPQPIAGSRID